MLELGGGAAAREGGRSKRRRILSPSWPVSVCIKAERWSRCQDVIESKDGRGKQYTFAMLVADRLD